MVQPKVKIPGNKGISFFGILSILSILLCIIWISLCPNVLKLDQRSNRDIDTTQLPVIEKEDHKSRPYENRMVPGYVIRTLDYIRNHQKAPDGYVGGRQFQNRERQLPDQTDQGEWIQYNEWDVKPLIKGKNRGPERLVTGSDGSAWYTQDHYRSFQKIKE